MSEIQTKTIGIKFPDSDRAAETVTVDLTTTVRDVLEAIGLGGSGFLLSDPNDPTVVFQPGDALFARVTDSQMLQCSALVDAGCGGDQYV